MEIRPEQFRAALKIVNDYRNKMEDHYKHLKKGTKATSKFAYYNPETFFLETNCSTRLRNTLQNPRFNLGISVCYETQLKDLKVISITEFETCRSVGKNTIDELKELCYYAGVTLRP